MLNIRNERESDYKIVEDITRKASIMYTFRDVWSIILSISCGDMKILYRSWIL